MKHKSRDEVSVEIREAEFTDLDELAKLFDGYRQFYKQESDLPGAAEFMQQRLEEKDSTVFLAFHGSDAVGFVQLYPSFSSVDMQRLFILNDLFVSPSMRHHGIGMALIQKAEDFAANVAAVRLVLETEFSNSTAQSLYEKMGWEKDEVHYYFEKDL